MPFLDTTVLNVHWRELRVYVFGQEWEVPLKSIVSRVKLVNLGESLFLSEGHLSSLLVLYDLFSLCVLISQNCLSSGNRYVLVVQDHFTKYVNAYPMVDQTASTVARLLCEQYIPEHGIPEELFSDQGCQYESEILQDICKRLNISKKRTTPYHPRGNGMVERFNRTLKDQLAKVLFHSGGEWDQYLSAVVLSFNATPHSSTGYSPFFLAHGCEPRLPAHMYLDSPSDGAVDTPQTYGSALVNRMVWRGGRGSAKSAAGERLRRQR